MPASGLPKMEVAEAVGASPVRSMKAGEARGGVDDINGTVGAEAAGGPGLTEWLCLDDDVCDVVWVCSTSFCDGVD